MIIHIHSIDTINQSAKEFIEKAGNKKVFCFNGSMGAGKTTFIKAICKELGVKETVNSPTFSIVNEYEAADGRIIYHFDCYRIIKIQEAVDLGVEDYLYSGNLCFIEWAENIASLLPDDAINLNIAVNTDESRFVEIS